MKIFLAGVEGGEPQKVKNEIEYAFYSYYYLRGNKRPQVMVGTKEAHKILFIDSGAHSFFNEKSEEGVMSATFHSKKSKTKETPQEYFDAYVIWLKENFDKFDYFAELDIGEIVTQEVVLEWRDVLRKENLYSKCVPVYHPTTMDWNDYMEMLDTCESGYIALEGDRGHRKRLNYNKLIKPAYDRGIKVHGFAMTKTEVLRNHPFYSVDSTSWLASEMYGTLPLHEQGKIKQIRYQDKKKFTDKLCKLDTNILFGDDLAARRLYNMRLGIKAYKEYEHYYTKLWQKRNINWNG